MKNLDTSLYFITDSTQFTEEEFLRRTEAALQGGVTILQLREKDVSTRDYLNLAEKVHELTRRYGVPLIIEDRLDIAMAVDALRACGVEPQPAWLQVCGRAVSVCACAGFAVSSLAPS